MQISVIPTYSHLSHLDLSNKIVVVIDVLRATSVIITALSNGAKAVIPTSSPEDAFLLANNFSPESTLLGGERKCEKIPGFHLGNSPTDYSQENVAGKTIIFTSTNGAQAINASLSASQVIIGSLLNGKAISCSLKNTNKDIVLACAGTRGSFSLEDTFAAGMIIFHLLHSELNFTLTDLSFFAYKFFVDNKANLPNLFRWSQAGQRLLELGYDRDIKFCSQMNLFSLVPIWKDYQVILP